MHDFQSPNATSNGPLRPAGALVSSGDLPASRVMPHTLGSWFVFAALLIGLFAGGCTDQEQIDRLKQETQAVRDSMNQLLEEQRALREQSDQRATRLAQANRLITDVLGRLSKISRKEALLTDALAQARDQAGDIEQVELAPSARSVRDAMETALADIEQQLVESRAAIEELEQRRSELTGDLEELTTTVDRLERQLAEKERTVQQLRTEIEAMSEDLRESERQNEELETVTAELRTTNEDLMRAYVAVADADSLEELGILDRPFLGFLGRTKIERLDPTKFREVATETDRITLPADRDAVKLRSAHRHDPELYRIEGDELRIQDPEKFWTLSRFLVVEIDR